LEVAEHEGSPIFLWKTAEFLIEDGLQLALVRVIGRWSHGNVVERLLVLLAFADACPSLDGQMVGHPVEPATQ
jgi:hypothetical protein